MKKQRLVEIDYMKAFAAILVIFIHVISRHRTSELSYQIWEFSHFAVGLFVFCSGYIVRFKQVEQNSDYTTYNSLFKRLWRVYYPYLGYLFFHFTLFSILPQLFNYFAGDRFTSDYLVNTFALRSGAGNNWIPRVFVIMTLLYFLQSHLEVWLKRDLRLYAFVSSLILSVAFMFIDTDPHEWIARAFTWYAVYLAGILFYDLWRAHHEFMNKILFTLLLSFFGMFTVLELYGLETSLFTNKYPPTFFYIVYQVMMSIAIFKFINFINSRTEIPDSIGRFATFLSNQSYNIFFSHLIVMDVIQRGDSFIFELVSITALSILAVFLLERAGRVVQSFRSKPVAS